MGYTLKSCVWEITLACCFSCRYCGSRGGKAREQELCTEECLSVAAQLAALDCERVSLIGGEVFLRPDWPQIVRALTDRGIRVSIITNGFLFTDDLIGQIWETGVEAVALSIDGPKKIHDRYRQEGSFDRASRALMTLAQKEIPVAVITTVNRENAGHLETFYEDIRRWPIYAWQIQACSPMGNAAASGIDYRFDPRKVLDFVRSHAADAPFRLGVADNIGYYTEDEGMLRGNLSGQAFFTGCRAGLSAIGIDSVGNVRGCESMYDDCFIEGNVRSTSLRQIWEDPAHFRYNRDFTPELLTGPCAACPHGTYCAGGCRSYNYFVHHKLYEAPACARTR